MTQKLQTVLEESGQNTVATRTESSKVAVIYERVIKATESSSEPFLIPPGASRMAISIYDAWDTGGVLCFLGSHAENTTEYEPICSGDSGNIIELDPDAGGVFLVLNSQIDMLLSAWWVKLWSKNEATSADYAQPSDVRIVVMIK